MTQSSQNAHLAAGQGSVPVLPSCPRNVFRRIVKGHRSISAVVLGASENRHKKVLRGGKLYGESLGVVPDGVVRAGDNVGY
jgi:hypothetical protein